jgi:hypothetical protein
MGKRKVTILESAVIAVAEVSFFIESKGLPATAKKFVDEAFAFFESLSDERFVHRPCSYKAWSDMNYRCAMFRKKYAVAYMNLEKEIIICEFVSMKLLK